MCREKVPLCGGDRIRFYDRGKSLSCNTDIHAGLLSADRDVGDGFSDRMRLERVQTPDVLLIENVLQTHDTYVMQRTQPV